MRHLLIGFLSVCSLVSASAFAGEDKIFEVGVTAGQAYLVKHYDSSEVEPGAAGAVSGYASFNLWIVKALVEGNYSRIDGNERFEARGQANLWFIDVNELYVRKDAVDGDQTRAMGGLRFNTPDVPLLGKLSIGAGYMFMNWVRPGETENTMHAAYAGATLHTRIWKFQNELRVAAYWAPQFTKDYMGALEGTTDIVESAQTGAIASDRLYMEVIKVPLVTFGPELRAQVTQLPDGTEWLATIGVGGKFRPLFGL